MKSRIPPSFDWGLEGCDAEALRLKIAAVCSRYKVKNPQRCESEFFKQAYNYRKHVAQEMVLQEEAKTQLKNLEKATDVIAEVLESLNEEAKAALPEFIRNEIAYFELCSSTLNSAAGVATASRREREKSARLLIAQQFVVACQRFKIPVTWSKEIDYDAKSGEEKSSAHFLGCIYAAGGMKSEGKSTPTSSANYYLSKLSKGFTCDVDGIVVRVRLNSTCLEPNHFLANILAADLAGDPQDYFGERAPRASVTGHEVGLPNRPFYEIFRWVE